MLRATQLDLWTLGGLRVMGGEEDSCVGIEVDRFPSADVSCVFIL